MIDIKDLTFSYRKKAPLFSSLSLSEPSGSIIGLLGKNGAGKSTLLRIICGLLAPDAGAVSVMNETPINRKPDFLANLFFVPEEFALPNVSMRNYVKAMQPLYPQFDVAKFTKITEQFELTRESNIQGMSYGQKKKFLIAFALSTNCMLLVLDEPTNGLDIPSKAIFRKVVAGALTEEQTVIISTHQVKDIDQLIDKVVLLDQGRVIFSNSLLNITDQYAFTFDRALDKDNCLYYEQYPGGYKMISEANGTSTDIDLELLFNALINGATLKMKENEPAI